MKGGGNMSKFNITANSIRHCVYGDCRIRINNKSLKQIKTNTTTFKNHLNKTINLAANLNAKNVEVKKDGDYFEIEAPEGKFQYKILEIIK